MWPCSNTISPDWTNLQFGDPANAILRTLANRKDWAHLLILGRDGGGKTLRVRTFLSACYQQTLHLQMGSMNIRCDEKQKKKHKQKRSKGPDVIDVLSSEHHVEVNVDPAVTQWTGVMQEDVMKNLLKTLMLTFDVKQHGLMKVLVVHHAELLSKESQHSMLKLIEQRTNTLRIIFLSNQENKFIAALRSRCLVIRVPAPTPEQVVVILKSKVEAMPLPLPIPNVMFHEIAKKAEGNLYVALKMLYDTITDPENKDLKGIKEPSMNLTIKDMIQALVQDKCQSASVFWLYLAWVRLMEKRISPDVLLGEIYRALSVCLREDGETLFKIHLWDHFFRKLVFGREPLGEMWYYFAQVRQLLHTE